MELVKKNEMGNPRVGESGVIGQLVSKIEMADPRWRKTRWLIQKLETLNKLEKLVKKIQNNEPQVGKVGKSVRLGQEEYTGFEEDAMLAGAGEEDKIIKCFDDVTGKELPWQAVKEACEKELKCLRELGVCDKVDERTAVAKCNVTQTGLTLTQHLRRSQCKSVQELWPESSKSGDRVPEMQQAIGNETGKGISTIGDTSWVQESLCFTTREGKLRVSHTETTWW